MTGPRTSTPVGCALANAGLVGIRLYNRGGWDNRRRQILWDNLPASAKLTLRHWRCAQAWWETIRHVHAKTGTSGLTFRNSVQPLIAAGWVVEITPHLYTGMFVLSREGRIIRQRLLLASRR